MFSISRGLSLNSLEVGVVHRDVGEAVRAVQDVVAVAHLKQDTLYITEFWPMIGSSRSRDLNTGL